MTSKLAPCIRLVTAAVLAACLGACTEEPNLSDYTFESADAAADTVSMDATNDVPSDTAPDPQADSTTDVPSPDAGDAVEDGGCAPQCPAGACDDDGCGGTCTCDPNELCHPGSLTCMEPGSTERVATWSNESLSYGGRELVSTPEALAWASSSSLYTVPHVVLTTLDCSADGTCGDVTDSKTFSDLAAVASKLGDVVTTSLAVSGSKVAVMLQTSSQQQHGSLFAYDWTGESSSFDQGTVAEFHNDPLVAEGGTTALTTFSGSADRLYWVSQVYSGDATTWFLASSPSDLGGLTPSQDTVGYDTNESEPSGCLVSKELFLTSTHLWLQCDEDYASEYEAPKTLEARKLGAMGPEGGPADLMMEAAQGMSSVEAESVRVLALTDDALVRVGSDWDGTTAKVFTSAYSPGGGSSVNAGSTQAILEWSVQGGMSASMAPPPFAHRGDVAFVAVRKNGGGSASHTIHAMSLSGGTSEVPPIDTASGLVSSMVISPDGRFLYWSQSGSLDGPSGGGGPTEPTYSMELHRALIQ